MNQKLYILLSNDILIINLSRMDILYFVKKFLSITL